MQEVKKRIERLVISTFSFGALFFMWVPQILARLGKLTQDYTVNTGDLFLIAKALLLTLIGYSIVRLLKRIYAESDQNLGSKTPY